MRLESLSGLQVVELARAALVAEGLSPQGVGLKVTSHPRRKVVRLSYEGPAFQGRHGARWWAEHHALASGLSQVLGVAVQAYAYDEGDFEVVATYGNGRRVGGERLSLRTLDLPEEAEQDDAAFERVQRNWPLGHLAYVFGLTRRELVRLAVLPGVVLSLDGEGRGEGLDALLPHAAPHLRVG